MNLSFYIETLRLGVTNLTLHKLRSFLTSLGIIFGVGAVITMLAIGEGKKLQTLQAVEQLGATNVILRSVPPPESNSSTARRSRQLIYGLKRIEDLEAIRAQAQSGVLGPIEQIVPLRDTGQEIVKGELRSTANAIATTPEYLAVANLTMASGRFLAPNDMDEQRNICVLGAGVAQELFTAQYPIGQSLTIGGKIFEVVGVIRAVGLAGGKGVAMTGRDMNLDVYIPLTTSSGLFSDAIVKTTSGSREYKLIELSEIYVKVASADDVEPTAAALQRLVDIGHGEKKDVSVFVPREQLKLADESKRLFDQFMGGIAAISLAVGGIGIMNISLAAVTERTREIGIRRALGAERAHIVTQFLIETTTLSVTGGLLGVAAGVGLAVFVDRFSQGAYPTVVSLWSVLVSFSISASVGIAAGLYPALVAAHKDPIEALRHD